MIFEWVFNVIHSASITPPSPSSNIPSTLAISGASSTTNFL